MDAGGSTWRWPATERTAESALAVTEPTTLALSSMDIEPGICEKTRLTIVSVSQPQLEHDSETMSPRSSSVADEVQIGQLSEVFIGLTTSRPQNWGVSGFRGQ